MKRIILIIIVVALMLLSNRVFGQTVQIVRMDGTVEIVQIRSFDTQPKTLYIKPYGLNLQPANIPDRVNTYRPAYRPPAASPITIENPYFPVSAPFPEPENVAELETWKLALRALGELLWRISSLAK
jgi:hypothetical protein